MPDPDRTDYPYETRLAMAKAQAVMAVRRCNRPLAPQKEKVNAWYDLEGHFMKWYHNANEPSSEECAAAEINYKPKANYVRPFTPQEVEEILTRGRDLGQADGKKGLTRPRSYER